jgi:hypothetical protein
MQAKPMEYFKTMSTSCFKSPNWVVLQKQLTLIKPLTWSTTLLEMKYIVDCLKA